MIEYDTVDCCATKEEFQYKNKGRIYEKGNDPAGSSRIVDTNKIYCFIFDNTKKIQIPLAFTLIILFSYQQQI
jgi:hypothetical protein